MPSTTPPTLTTYAGSVPTRTDRATFAARADAFLVWLETFAEDELPEVLTWISDWLSAPALPSAGVTGGVLTRAHTLRQSVRLSSGVTLNANVWQDGDVVTLYNNSASDQTITAGAGVTMRLGGTTETGNRTVKPRGLVTALWISATEVIVGGQGVT